jgi:hypothetical protein
MLRLAGTTGAGLPATETFGKRLRLGRAALQVVVQMFASILPPITDQVSWVKEPQLDGCLPGRAATEKLPRPDLIGNFVEKTGNEGRHELLLFSGHSCEIVWARTD